MRSTNPREVSSPANSLMKVFRRALAEGTTKQGWLAVEGPFLVEEALNAAPRVKTHSVLVASGAAEKFSALLHRLPAEAEMTQVPDRLFESVAQTQSPQGIAALVELPAYKLEQVVAAANPLLVVACRLQDPGNLGTMMRTALAFSASAFLTLQETVSPFNPKAVRSSAGAIFRLPLVCGLDPKEALPFLSRTRPHCGGGAQQPGIARASGPEGADCDPRRARSHRIAGGDCPLRQPASEYPHPEGSGFRKRGDRGEHLSLRGRATERI